MNWNRGFIFFVLLMTCTRTLAWQSPPVQSEPVFSDQERQMLRTFAEVFKTIQDNSATEIDSVKLFGGAVRGMLPTLDPHTYYFDPRETREREGKSQGEIYGVGILIRAERPGYGRTRIVEPPQPGTPAYEAGLRVDDVITRIEGEAIDDWEFPHEIVSRIKGPSGTTVHLTIERQGIGSPLEFDVIRRAIPLDAIKVAFHLEPGIGYIRIESFFSDSTSQELNAALTELDEANLDGLILDLRHNPGGDKNQAIKVADRFLKKGQTIIAGWDRAGFRQTIVAPNGRRHDYPMVVLIDGYTASAAEIVSGALQDHDRALFVGGTTRGKGLVETIFDLRQFGQVWLTNEKYYTPSGRLIQRSYSDGFFTYHTAARQDGADRGEAFTTDAGRTVYGGGGITPDFEVLPTLSTRLSSAIRSLGLDLRFARQLTEGPAEAGLNFRYTRQEIDALSDEACEDLLQSLWFADASETMTQYHEFLKQQDIEFSTERFEDSRQLLAAGLRWEVFVRLFGEEAATRARLEIDNQVIKALELLPAARALLEG